MQEPHWAWVPTPEKDPQLGQKPALQGQYREVQREQRELETQPLSLPQDPAQPGVPEPFTSLKMPQLPQQPPPSSCLWNLARSGAHFSSCLLAPPLAQPRPKDPDCWGSRDQKNFCMEHRRAREEPKRILGQALTQWASEGLGQGGCMETQETKAG